MGFFVSIYSAFIVFSISTVFITEKEAEERKRRVIPLSMYKGVIVFIYIFGI
jgi:hypothetical protein